MDKDAPQSSSATRGRRTNQRYRKGAHNVTLDASARLALTQHFVSKGRKQPSTANDPTSLTISSYYTAPLGARSILEAVLPPTHIRSDLSADPIYFNHPSAREDLQHSLLLSPTELAHNAVTIKTYYITGVHSTNTQNDISFHVYIYLPNDYDHTTDIIDIVTIQLDNMRSAGYPTSPTSIHATTVTTISDDPPTTTELNDNPIDTTTL
jgi:hypothetical protein